MGLLDITDNPWFALSAGLLQAGGPSRTPISTGQALASGFNSLNEFKARQAEAEQMKQMQAFKQMQMDQFKQQQEDSGVKRQALMQLRSQLPDEVKPMFDIDPQGFLAKLQKQDEEYTLTPGSARFKGDKQIASVPIAPKEQTPPALVQEIEAWRNMPEGPQKDLLGKILQAKARDPQSNAQPFFQFLPTDQGYVAGNARTGTVAPVTMNGTPLVKPADNPALQAQIAGAKAGATAKAEASAKRDINMSGLGDLIGEAETILQGKSGAKPTGSAVGAGVDSVLGGIGVSTESANQAAKLKALGGALVMKMPRMEGPQSDKDTMLYKEMAGEVGNPMRPIAQRLAALETIKKLNQKYAGQSAQTGGVKFLGFE